MKIFILEDSQERIDAFEHVLKVFDGGPHEVTVARWKSEACAKFTPPYDLLLLDHDLGGEQMVDTEEDNTGSGFCRFIQEWEASDLGQPMVVIHSYNPEGASRMGAILRESGFTRVYKEPFGRAILSFLASITTTGEKAA